MRSLLLSACLSLAAGAADADGLTLTIYNNNLMLVHDERVLTLAKGRSKVELQDVAASIRPETVSLRGKDLGIVEQNFDYDLLSPAKMMEKAVGRQIQVVRTNPATGKQVTETATVLSNNNGVILKIGNRIEVLRDDGIPTRVVFSSIPENLRPSPTLSVTVESGNGGATPVTLSYLATGLSWSADYVGFYDEARGTINLQGWVTIKNQSGSSFRNADTELIAGAMNVSGGNQDYRYGAPPATPGTQAGQARQVADFYAYNLPERMTIANEQTKQVSFLDANLSNAEKIYSYTRDDFHSRVEAEHADVEVRFGGAATPLPAGTVRVYMHDDKGESKFVGEDRIGHTPAGSELDVKLGEAFDVTVQPTETANEKTKTGARHAMAYTLRNARANAVTVHIRQTGLGTGAEVVSESDKSRRLDADTLEWAVEVPANGARTLSFVLETSG